MSESLQRHILAIFRTRNKGHPLPMGSALGIGIGVIVSLVAAGLVTYIVYYAVSTALRPSPPPSPPLPPPGQSYNMFFRNDRSEAIWIIPTYGTATDPNGWTNWPYVSGTSGPKVVPHTPDLKPIEIQPGNTDSMTIYTAGMASVNFTVRVGCRKPSMICDIGDSGFVPFLDAPGNTQTNLYRNAIIPVPFKPVIDTKVEMSWGCAYKNGGLCSVNPSCIDNPASCPGGIGMQALMDTHTGAIWHSDGLLYGTDGKNIVLPLTNPPDPTSPGVGALTSVTFFDLSCVDGYTVPITLQVKRPLTSVSPTAVPETYCRVNYSQLAPAIDVDTNDGWQTIASTASIKLADCPTNELLWPPPTLPERVSIAIAGTSPPSDGFNTGTIGQSQYVMPWLTQAMSANTPTGSPPVKLLASFVRGTTTNLTYYRDPAEVAALPGSGLSINDRIGCGSTCHALTENRGNSQMYPKPGGKVLPASYIVDQNAPPLLPSDRGVSDICCITTPGTAPSAHPPDQCNTSRWWYGNGATGPVQPTDLVANYGFGFFANVYAPDDSSPWYVDGGPAGPQTRNPYTGGPNMSRYVQTVRTGATGQHTVTRAYTYAFDDPYSTVICKSDVSANLLASDGRGEHYAQYQVMMIISNEAP